jgi:hypothetical protein
MLFEHQNLDAGTREEIAQHDASRTTPGDAALYGNSLRHRVSA